MLQFARTYGHLDSTDINDVQSKMWTIRHVLQSYLSVQHVQQAFVLLENVQKGEYGVKASSRYYDPFTNYYGVRGKTKGNAMFFNFMMLVVGLGVGWRLGLACKYC